MARAIVPDEIKGMTGSEAGEVAAHPCSEGAVVPMVGACGLECGHVSNADTFCLPGRLCSDALPRGLVRQLPFRPAFVKPPGCPPGARQPAHRLVGEGAERSAAVGDDLAVGWQLCQTSV